MPVVAGYGLSSGEGRGAGVVLTAVVVGEPEATGCELFARSHPSRWKW
jgi:hypothetical protein